MARENDERQIITNRTSAEDCQDVDKILSVVVKRRKTVPSKFMEVNKQMNIYEIQKLENAEVVINENQEKEKFRKVIQGFRKLKSFQFSLHDLHEAEYKLEKYIKKTKEINCYLEKRRFMECKLKMLHCEI